MHRGYIHLGLSLMLCLPAALSQLLAEMKEFSEFGRKSSNTWKETCRKLRKVYIYKEMSAHCCCTGYRSYR